MADTTVTKHYSDHDPHTMYFVVGKDESVECEFFSKYMYINEHINKMTFNLIGNVLWSTDDYLTLLNQAKIVKNSVIFLGFLI